MKSALAALVIAMIELHESNLPNDASQLNGMLAKPLLTNTVIHGSNQVNSIPESAFVLFNARTVEEFNNEDMIT